MMLTRSTDAPPFFSDHFVTGFWNGGQWALHIGVALLCLAVLGALIPVLAGWFKSAGGHQSAREPGEDQDPQRRRPRPGRP